MSLYTKNGKLIVKSENGVLKLVTGDCCCPCTTDRGCGLPHVVLNFGSASVSGHIAAGTTASFDMQFDPSNSNNSYIAEQTIYRNQDGIYDDSWTSFLVATWSVTCTNDCGSDRDKTAKLSFASAPAVRLYQYGSLCFGFGGTAAQSQSPVISLPITVSRAFKAKVMYYNNNVLTEIPKGSTYTMEVGLRRNVCLEIVSN